MSRRHQIGIIILLVFSLTGLGAKCQKDKKKNIKHLVVAPGQSADELYAKAEVYLTKKRFEEAIEHFEAVKNNFPYEKISIESELKVGDTYFAWKKYLQAAEAYELFRKLHPYHPKADYAMARQVESLFKEAPKVVDRDLTYCKQSITVANNFFQRFPDSSHKDIVWNAVHTCKTRLSGHEFYVGRFYYRQKAYKASANRLEGLLENHNGYGYDDKGAWYLGLDYMKLRAYDEAEETFQHLIDHYPLSPYTKKAAKKLKKINSLKSTSQPENTPKES